MSGTHVEAIVPKEKRHGRNMNMLEIGVEGEKASQCGEAGHMGIIEDTIDKAVDMFDLQMTDPIGSTSIQRRQGIESLLGKEIIQDIKSPTDTKTFQDIISLKGIENLQEITSLGGMVRLLDGLIHQY